jgi:hypothetical protein
MRQPIFTLSSALAASALLLACMGVLLACGWVDDDDLLYSFFAPETNPSDEYRPFSRSFHALYTEYLKEDNVADFDSINVEEWRTFLPAEADRGDVRDMLYRTGERDFARFLAGGSDSAGVLSWERVLRAIPDGNLRRETAEYLAFAKRCEPFVTWAPEWTWSDNAKQLDPRNDTARLNALLRDADARVARVGAPFLRERSLFQHIRLLFHARRFEDCARAYAEHAASFPGAGAIAYRAMGYAAGALVRLKRFAEANRYYARIYDHCPPMKTTAYLSFHPQEEEDWNAALALARGPREECVLWHLLGIYADPLRAMREIARRDRGSDLLDLLLVRAVNIEEELFLPERWPAEGSADRSQAFRSDKVDRALLAFIDEQAARGGTHAPQLWNLAAAYLRVALGEGNAALPYLAAVHRIAPHDTLVQEQARVIDIVRIVDRPGALTMEREEELRRNLVWLREESRHRALRRAPAFTWACRRLSAIYAAQGDAAKAVCLWTEAVPGLRRDSAQLARLFDYLTKADPSSFDEFLASLCPYKRADVVEQQAVLLLQQGRWSAALERFEAEPGAGGALLPGDPFLVHINDCHDCDHAAPKAVPYSKRDFARRMAGLERLATTDRRNAAKHFFALANGCYNMTYFGNARRVYETAITPGGFADFYGPHPERAGDPLFDCTRAERYYRKAMEVSRDAEFRARCAFMAAKCEQNMFFLVKPESYNGDFRSGTYFRLLRASYSSTRYYREIIRECGYFATFVRAR